MAGNPCSRVWTLGVGPHPRVVTVGDSHPREGLAESYSEGFVEPSDSLKVITRFLICLAGLALPVMVESLRLDDRAKVTS
jgi:hypothetical protein